MLITLTILEFTPIVTPVVQLLQESREQVQLHQVFRSLQQGKSVVMIQL